jgi:hypothetical protein
MSQTTGSSESYRPLSATSIRKRVHFCDVFVTILCSVRLLYVAQMEYESLSDSKQQELDQEVSFTFEPPPMEIEFDEIVEEPSTSPTVVDPMPSVSVSLPVLPPQPVPVSPIKQTLSEAMQRYEQIVTEVSQYQESFGKIDPTRKTLLERRIRDILNKIRNENANDLSAELLRFLNGEGQLFVNERVQVRNDEGESLTLVDLSRQESVVR